MARTILLILAIICFALATFGIATTSKISWRDAGFAFVTASLLV